MDGINEILQERGTRYGEFDRQAEVVQRLKQIIFSYKPRVRYSFDQVEAIEQICGKLGRIINGDADYADSWTDIAGYAKLVSDRLLKYQEK